MFKLRSRLVPRFVQLSKPYFTSEEWKKAWAYLVLLLGLLVVNSLAAVEFNRQTGSSTNAFAERDREAYTRTLHSAMITSVVLVVIYGFYYLVRDRMAIHWRQWMTKHYLENYFKNRAFYKLVHSQSIDNPDQRLSDDINSFTTKSIYFLLIFVETFFNTIAFSYVLWVKSKILVTVLLLYSTTGTLVTWLVFGRPLVGLNFFLLRREADFRYGLVRVRENAESIAFYQGEPQEHSFLGKQFHEVATTFRRLVSWQYFLNTFQYSFAMAAAIIPAVVLAPRVLDGDLEVGSVTEAIGAFASVFSALGIIVNKFDSLSYFAAGVGRLDRFSKALGNAGLDDEERHGEGHTQIQTIEESELAMKDLAVKTPDAQRTLVSGLNLSLESGSGLLIVGASGGGKSSLLRAIAGLWTTGEGTVSRPPLSEMLFLPQRPYLIIGTLREQLLYPCGRDNATDQELDEALHFVNLPQLAENCGGFDVSADWSKILSLGEQQRLAIARVLLSERKFVVLDEATSALDDENEANVYETLTKSNATIISVSHRPQVARFHSHVLRLNGQEKWELLTSDEFLEEVTQSTISR